MKNEREPFFGYREFSEKKFTLRVYSEDIDGVWPSDTIIDVDVILEPDSKFTGMFCTIDGVLKLMQKDEHTGESNNGEYFFIPNLLVLKDLNLKLLVKTISTIISDGELGLVFRYALKNVSR